MATFRCYLDTDIEIFLHNKSIDFLKRGLSATYLMLNHELFEQNIIKIEAYFTLSHKVMSVPENISKTQIKKMTHNNKATQLHFVLIGQIGKHITKDEKSSINCEEILNTAISVVREASSLIPCRFILVECSKTISELNIYENMRSLTLSNSFS